MKNLVCLFFTLSLLFIAGCSSSIKRLPNADGGVTGDIGRMATDETFLCYLPEDKSKKAVIESVLTNTKKTEKIIYRDVITKENIEFENLYITKAVSDILLENGKQITISSSKTSHQIGKSMVLHLYIRHNESSHVGHITVDGFGETRLTNLNCIFIK